MDADGETMATATTTTTRDESNEGIDAEAEDNRKEAILASTQSLQPNFNRSNVTQKQISKLQELHKRRMQIKANSKIHNKPKGSKNSQSRAINKDGESSKKLKESTSSSSSISQEHQHKTVPKTPQKLYWGLDTKERWERKANM